MKGGNQSPADIFFTSATNGVAVSGGPAGAGAIYHTVDGGNSWTQVTGVTGSFRSVWFADANTGYAVGDSGTLYTTTDGGATWSQRPLAGATPANLTSIRCAGVICLIATDTGSHLIRTTDAGFTATDVSPSTQQIFAAAFSSPTQAVAAGQDGATVVSGDAGVTFSPIPATGGRIAGPFLQLRAASATVAFATGHAGTLARTGDGGETWTDLGVPTTGDVIDVSFPNASVVGSAVPIKVQSLNTFPWLAAGFRIHMKTRVERSVQRSKKAAPRPRIVSPVPSHEALQYFCPSGGVQVQHGFLHFRSSAISPPETLKNM